MDRTQVEALIETQVVNSIAQDAPASSIFMNLAQRLPNMTSGQTRMPVLDLLLFTDWVNGDAGFKQMSEQAWANVYINAAELAVIVPIPEAVVADSGYDIIGEVTPRAVESIGANVDAAAIFGINRPSEWQNDIITLARNAGNNVSGGVTYDTLMGVDGMISKIEQAGKMMDGVIGAMSSRGALRGIKSTDGIPLFNTSMQGATQYALDGAPMYFPQNGAFDATKAVLLGGNFGSAVYSVRQDVTVKILDQATIVDPQTKAVIYSLAQQDMIAIRIVFRMGWALPNPATRLNPGRSLIPFAYIEGSAANTGVYNATINVKDNAGTPDNIEGATIDVDGSRKTTGADGNGIFSLSNGTYDVEVKKKGYQTVKDTVNVNGAAATKAITLIPTA